MNWRKLLFWRKKPETKPEAKKPMSLGRAVFKAEQVVSEARSYTVAAIMPGVVGRGHKAAIAMDSNLPGFIPFAFGPEVAHFIGYPRLSFLATIAEYRAMASALSTELTREWIQINSSETAGDATKNKVTELTQKIKDIQLQQIIQRAAEHDALYGRGQVFMKIRGHDPRVPLTLSSKTIAKNSFVSLSTVEALWTTPSAYNASDPTAPDFYRPSKWWMLGSEVHASRLLTVITRPLPDMLKPAFNFGGMSLTQLAEPYVNNWLRTRSSVANIINNFSITALKTSMEQALTGGESYDGADIIDRAKLFSANRSNQGLMLLDFDREDLVQINAPLGSLDKLQAQAQEHMCAVSRLPAIILTGISPTGLNASSEGEIKAFYDWISAQQEAFWRHPIDTIIKVLQLSMYGAIDPDISWDFEPLYQMTPAELAKIRLDNATAAGTYLDRGVIAPDEQREQLARDPESGYQGLDLNREIELPTADDEGDEGDEDNDKKAA